MIRVPNSLLARSLAFVLISLGCLSIPHANAQATTRNVVVTLAPIGTNTKLELVALIVDSDIGEAGDHTTFGGQLTFKIHNTDKIATVDTQLGFPSWAGGTLAFDDKALSQFAISYNGDPVQAAWQDAPITLNKETRNIRWLAFPVHLVGDERAIIQVAFKQDIGDAIFPSVIFAQAPAILWKGYVGSARFTFRMPTLTTPEQFRAISPANSSFDGKMVNWLYDTFNPDAPITVQFVRPKLWRDIVSARAAVSQGDAKAAVTLGNLYTQIARTSQSASDFSLALAAYQKASDLDPASADGPLQAARLYDARLRGDFGKVSDENATRAAALDQWQRVLKVAPSNAEAKDAVAQDALALAQLARRGGGYTAALMWLDMARAAASSKLAISLLDNETRANRAGLALQQIDSAKLPDVLKQVQADAFGPDLHSDYSASLARLSLVQVSLNIAADRQSVSARLVPFPTTSPDLEKTLNDWLAALGKTPGATGQLEVDGDVYVLNLSLPVAPLRAADLPAMSETLLLREALTPATLEATHTDSLFTADDSFTARYALIESQRTAQAKVVAIDALLKPIGTPAPDETQELVRQLRVRLLETYRNTWQGLLSSSTVHVTWSGAAGRPEQWDLRSGDSQTLQSQKTSYETWTMVAVALFVLGILFVLGAVAMFLWQQLRPHPAAPPQG